MLIKVIKTSCIVGSIAFLLHGALAPFYETGRFRFTAPLTFLGIAVLLFLFLQRQRWTWLLVLLFTLSHAILFILFPPTEEFYGPLTSLIKVLAAIEALACSVIFIAMLLPGTKHWFIGSEIFNETNIDNFHAGEVFEVNYRNNFWDLIWFNIYQTPRSRAVQICVPIIILSFGSFIFSSLNDAEYSFGAKIIIVSVLLILIFVGLIALSFCILILIYIVRKFDIRTMQDCTLSISESGVLSETPFKVNGIKWSGIFRIKQSSKYIMIYVSDSAALLIPKRFFAQKTDMEKFINYSLQCLEKSKNATLLK